MYGKTHHFLIHTFSNDCYIMTDLLKNNTEWQKHLVIIKIANSDFSFY